MLKNIFQKDNKLIKKKLVLVAGGNYFTGEIDD